MVALNLILERTLIKYIGLSKAELENEKKVLEAMIYREKQRLIKNDDMDLLQKHVSYLRNLDYSLSKVREAQKKLEE